MLARQHTSGFFIVSLLLLSLVAAGVALPTSVSATNETSSGTIQGIETWTGSHSVSGDIVIAQGSRLIIDGGTTISMANGTALVAQGNLCAGDASCGAMAAGSAITFTWSAPSNQSMSGDCYIEPLWNRDPSCGEGVVIRNSVDLAKTKLNHLRLVNAYGFPDTLGISQGTDIRYGALVLDGASVNVNEATFQNVNTSSMLILDLAAPKVTGGTFVVGSDANKRLGAAIVAYGAGTTLSPVSVTNATFTGAFNGCRDYGDGRSALFTEESFVNVADNTVSNNDFGFFFKESAGLVVNNEFDIDCNGIDINGRREVLGTAFTLDVLNNTIQAGTGSGLTAYDGGLVHAKGNTMSAGDSGSGVQFKSSTVHLTRNIIGPVTGFNGVWSIGAGGDYIIDNNTFDGIPKAAIALNEYRDRGRVLPGNQRAHIANNTFRNLNGGQGECGESYSDLDPEFPCPVIHVFLASATIKDNTVTDNLGRGIMVTGGIADVQRNVIEGNDMMVVVREFDNNYGTRYASYGFFSANAWANTTGTANVSQVYNVTKSRVVIQQENIPNVIAGHNTPIWLRWKGSESNHNTSTPPTANMPPQTFPLNLEHIANATTLTYAELTWGTGVPLNRTQMHIQNEETEWGVQVQKGELFRLRVRSDAGFEANAAVSIKNPYGVKLYNLTTNAFGYTPRVVLPSDFHLDRDWDHYAVNDDENSCSDGVDNDGDSYVDMDDSDCVGGRELAVYHVRLFKWGKGIQQYEFSLTGEVDEVKTLENLPPSLSVSRSNGTSFRRAINVTGTAHDGMAGPYSDDWDAWWQQGGSVTEVRVKDPFTASWNDARFAVDTSGASEPTRLNNPFSSWYLEFDYSTEAEDDHVFEFRSYDGVDWSDIHTRTFKLNTQPPTISVTSPVSGSFHDSGLVTFTGTAADLYAGAQGSDIQKIWFSVDGAQGQYQAVTSTEGSQAWSYTWNFSALPSGWYNFTIWASDSNFCDGVVDECTPVTLSLEMENRNNPPVVQLLHPVNGTKITANAFTQIAGFARDPDADGDVRRVDVRIVDLQTNLEMPNPPGPVRSILPNGAWSVGWNTLYLPHDHRYRIEVMAFDGYDNSIRAESAITINNPADINNNPPKFISAAWPTHVTIFCDYHSRSLDRCGEGGRLNLTSFFDDADPTDVLTFSVLDSRLTIADDLYQQLVIIGADGIARYDPTSMEGTNPDIGTWSLKDVMFEAFDQKTITYSRPVDFVVRSVNFTADRDDDGVVGTDGATFMGRGRPGASVKAYNVVKGTLLKQTTVGSDGNWVMTILQTDLDEGSNDIEFRYEDQKQAQFKLERASSDSGGIPWWIWTILAVLLLGVFGALFFFFFVEIEDEEGDGNSLDQTSMVAQQVVGQTQAHAAAPTALGWRWDAARNEWVPDGSQPPQ